jgi:hypothetical protein
MEQDREKPIPGSLTILKHLIKVRRAQQAQLPRENLPVLAGMQVGRRGDRNRQSGRRRQTVSRARPFARRRLITRRPPRVAMRARKP